MTNVHGGAAVDTRRAPVRVHATIRPGAVGWTLVGVAAGSIVAVWALLGLRLVWLQTGSMAPVFPQDSVLIAMPVVAESVSPGDVVSVVRTDGSLVTHRVVDVRPIDGGASLELKGDDNDAPDTSRYVVTHVGLVIAGIPFGGQFVRWASTPGAIQVVFVLLALAAMWALWPRTTRRPRAQRARHRAEGNG